MVIQDIKIKIQRVRKNSDLSLPQFQTAGASGCDLMADIHAPLLLRPRERCLIPTGIAIAIPKGFEAQLRPRSGLAAKQGVTLVNAPGTIDADYRGEIKVILINLGDKPVYIQRGDRIAQLVLQRVFQFEWEETEALDETQRAGGGFGHTGIGADL